MAAVSPAEADSVYFLMFPGWEREFRSNRWHYATRWARRLPTVLVQPTLTGVSEAGESEPEPRIPNARVLRIKAVQNASELQLDSLVQLGQVRYDMKQHGYERPVLWFYNPSLAGLYASLPAFARIYHATENYFDFEGLPELFMLQTRAALLSSDLIVCVSGGVASGIKENVRVANAAVVTNGCDFKSYKDGRPDTELDTASTPFTRTAIYAGNVNSRLDFGLLSELCRRNPTVLFAFYGRVHLEGQEEKQWNALIGRSNVRFFGEVDPDRLPDLYAAADIGIVPYKQNRWLVENGFPLKVLEMAATGLPVVSTLMRPIEGLAAGIEIAASRKHFLSAFIKHGRKRSSASELDQLRAVAAANDYDVKFQAILRLIDGLNPSVRTPTRLDVYAEQLGSYWSDSQQSLLTVVRGKSGPSDQTPGQAIAAPPKPEELIERGATATSPDTDSLRARIFIASASRVAPRQADRVPVGLKRLLRHLFGLAAIPGRH